jgi:hypothetical protein
VFEPTVSTRACTPIPMEVANTVGSVGRTEVLRSAGSERGWWTRGVARLVEKVTLGSVSTPLWLVIESADPVLRHGRKAALRGSRGGWWAGQFSLVDIPQMWQAQGLRMSQNRGLEEPVTLARVHWEPDSGVPAPPPDSWDQNNYNESIYTHLTPG